MKYLHTMVRVTDLETSLEFYCQRLGMVQVTRWDYEQGQFTLVMQVSQSTDHHGMAEWRLCAPLTIFPLNCFRMVRPYPWLNPGCPCQIQANGKLWKRTESELNFACLYVMFRT